MAETMIPIGAMIAALDAMEAYVPYAQRYDARAAALAHSIGYAYPATHSHERKPFAEDAP